MVYAKHFSPLQYDLKIYDKVSKSDPVAVPILGSGVIRKGKGDAGGAFNYSMVD